MNSPVRIALPPAAFLKDPQVRNSLGLIGLIQTVNIQLRSLSASQAMMSQKYIRAVEGPSSEQIPREAWRSSVEPTSLMSGIKAAVIGRHPAWARAGSQSYTYAIFLYNSHLQQNLLSPRLEACKAAPSRLKRSVLLQHVMIGSRGWQGAVALLKLCIAGRCSREPHVPLAVKPARRPTLFAFRCSPRRVRYIPGDTKKPEDHGFCPIMMINVQ